MWFRPCSSGSAGSDESGDCGGLASVFLAEPEGSRVTQEHLLLLLSVSYLVSLTSASSHLRPPGCRCPGRLMEPGGAMVSGVCTSKLWP